MKNPSVMQHSFARVPTVGAPRSVFNRSHGYKTTFDAGYLIPFYVDEVLPGDTFNLHATLLVRLNSPTIRPFMDNVYLDTFFFFVPNRLIWTNFVKFMGEQASPGDSISFTVPQVVMPNVAAGGVAIGTLYDYFGIPTGALSGGGGTTGLSINNLHGRAYNLIYNQWFRDQNLQASITVDLGDGPDTESNYVLRKRGKRHDYFTSVLPFLQKGTAVSLPLSGNAVVVSAGTATAPFFNTATLGGAGDRTINAATGATTLGLSANAVDSVPLRWGTTSGDVGLFANLSTVASAITINALREAITLQQFLESDARGGTRYTELVKNHFQVTSPDARLQRAELLSTSSERIDITPVTATAPATGVYVGSLGGFGTGSPNASFSKSFTEHGVLIGLCMARADLTYQQGLDRMWSRSTRYDFAFPTFAHLGEQAIRNKEIFANLVDGTGAAQKDGTFGYIPRYDEYRFKNSKITGLLRSTAAGTLDVWHAAQTFGTTQPTLGTTFIQEDPPLDRLIQIPSEPHFILDTYFALKCARPLPVNAVPGLNKL